MARTASRGLTLTTTVVILVVLVVLVAGGFFLLRGDESAGAGNGAPDLFTVRRGSFDVTVPTSGELAALRQTEIINQIRIRADVTPLSLPDSPSIYEDAILEERALELAFEGKRWFDLVRMGRRNDYARKNELIEVIVSNVPSTQKRILATKLTNPLGWYLPIYETEIERNANLVQNPYYIF